MVLAWLSFEDDGDEFILLTGIYEFEFDVDAELVTGVKDNEGIITGVE